MYATTGSENVWHCLKMRQKTKPERDSEINLIARNYVAVNQRRLLKLFSFLLCRTKFEMLVLVR